MKQEFVPAGEGDQTPGSRALVPSVQPDPIDVAPADETVAGDVLPAEECSGLGSTLLTGAAIGLGVLVLGAMVSDSEPPPHVQPRKRRRSRNRGGAWTTANYPLLPQWLFDLDQIRQNTVEEKRSLSTDGWDGIRKDTDAIILMGHVVSRGIAIKATGLLGHEALVYAALRKRAFMKKSTRWFSDKLDYTPVDTFDENDAEKLASKIETELCAMPLWCQFVSQADIGSIRDRVERILAHQSERQESAKTRMQAARAGVSWKSRKRPKPGEEYYNSVAKECANEIYRSEQIEKAGRRAIADLESGQVVAARAFVAGHQSPKLYL